MKSFRISFLDAILLVVLAGSLAWVLRRLAVELDYQWNWSVIPQYFLYQDKATGQWHTNLLLQGLFTTLRLSIWSTILATILGLLMGLCRLSSDLFRRLLGWSYVETVRNLPPLVLVFIFYFFVSEQIMPSLGLSQFAESLPPGWKALLSWSMAPPATLPAFLSAVITLAIYEGAYITEIIRAGIQSVEKGQWEAAHALGLSSWQRMRHVILPQAFRRILPPLAGQFISAIKDSAIVSAISIQEMTFQGMELMSATYLTFEVWITVFFMYLVLTLTCSLAVAHLERRFPSRAI